MAWQFWHEVGRKIIHITILIALALYFLIEESYSKQAALLFMVLLLIIFLILEYLRLEMGWNIPFLTQFVRPKEKDQLIGVVFFLSATIIALAVFEPQIALAALLMTTFGDMVAALAGKKWGTTILFRNKTMVGFFSELAVNLVVGMLLLDQLYVILAMAITATAVETLVDELDDNLLIPLFAGFVGQVIYFSL